MKIDDAEVERRLEWFRAAVKKAGFKLTHQRLEIFREVASSLEHPDAEKVFRAIQARLPTVSIDTVYRTLRFLSELGLVATLGAHRDSVRFDANLDPHHHYVCVRCELVRDFKSAELNALPIPEAAKEFGSVVAAHVEVRGVCRKCARERAEESAATKSHNRNKRSRK